VALEVDAHKEILVELEKSNLCNMPADKSLSSIGTRIKQTTMGTFLCSVIRHELNLDCVLIVGGCIRAARSYKGERHFSYAHLKTEVPFPTAIIPVLLPGRVLAEMIE